MEPLKISIAVPFRLDGKAEDHPGCKSSFNIFDIRAYLDALEKEIIASSADSEDLQVLEIEFVNGSFAHLGTGNIKRIADCIKAHFNVHPNVKYTLHATPSGFDFFILSEVKQLKNSSVILEYPAISDEGLAADGFRCSAELAQAAADSCFQNGFRYFTLVVSPALCPDEAAFTETVKAMLAKQPEEIRFDAPLSPEFLAVAETVFEDTGFVHVKGTDAWHRGDRPLRRRYANQIGCGPYALSIFDGQAVRSTADFEFYCANSEDFEALITHGA